MITGQAGNPPIRNPEADARGFIVPLQFEAAVGLGVAE